jgi:dTDP-4-dehydrorhamnose 3,5-epimerase-like enzyme
MAKLLNGMQREHKPVNFQDSRGTITDIFVRDPKEHCTIIMTRKGSVRGNHFHKLSRQYDFIVSGRFEVFSQRAGEPAVESMIVGPSDLLTWEPNDAHEFVALEDSVLITFVDGMRGGENYEKDTYRLSTPLHEQAKNRSSRKQTREPGVALSRDDV